ncbi:MAG: arginine--tRNA ligase [Candidatus Cloacimonetes bacterium 4572_65]|nr:MAG: arginine--tRNA ligase [Candidatus Cloacimonetes bacterium 4572_65]
MIKNRLKDDISICVAKLRLDNNYKYSVEIPNNLGHGDYSSNVALVLSKLNEMNPRDLAEKIKIELLKNKDIKDVQIAGPGFINITLNISIFQGILYDVLKAKESYGSSNYGANKRVLLEFVSANPTGPLNIVSARAATYGDTLYRVLTWLGFEAKREFYVNDAGNQVDILAESLELRLREARGEHIGEFPVDAYHGEYLIEMAEVLNTTDGNRLLMLPEKDRIEKLKEYAIDAIHEMQLESLEKYGVEFDNWVSEKKLRNQGVVEEVLSFLAEADCTYEKDDAIWFSASKFGDDKDRVLMKADGTITYFVPDLAYHLTKYQRGFDYIVDVLGPDHHGYVPRLKAAFRALDYEEEKLEVVFLQQINLFEDGEKVKMSKRLGKIITMNNLIDEVGKDVVRFFFVDRKTNAHLNFDMDLARKQSEENPVYYIQYAHARICSVIKKARKEHKIRIGKPSRTSLTYLIEPDEVRLMKKLISFPGVLENVATSREPNKLSNYVFELAGMFHKYYAKHQIIDLDQLELTKGRLFMIIAIRNTIAIALDLMAISAPEKMKKSAVKKPTVSTSQKKESKRAKVEPYGKKATSKIPKQKKEPIVILDIDSGLPVEKVKKLPKTSVKKKVTKDKTKKKELKSKEKPLVEESLKEKPIKRATKKAPAKKKSAKKDASSVDSLAKPTKRATKKSSDKVVKTKTTTKGRATKKKA